MGEWTFFGTLARFAASFLVTVALVAGLLAFAAHKTGSWPKEPAKGRPYAAEAWGAPGARPPVPAARRAGKGPRRPAAAPGGAPATVTEARRWAKCHGPACYQDVRGEAAPFLNHGL